MSDKSHQNYVQKLESRLKWAFQVAKEHNQKELVQHKQYHNQKMKCMRIDVGDQVLVLIKAFGTDHKITDKWENDPHVVEENLRGKPIYKVKPVKYSDGEHW